MSGYLVVIVVMLIMFASLAIYLLNPEKPRADPVELTASDDLEAPMETAPPRPTEAVEGESSNEEADYAAPFQPTERI